MENETISNFIHDIIDEDLKNGFPYEIHTRFPPEPNGCLHIGSAKAIWINWYTAKKYGGRFNLRFDDTNPTKEKTEFVDSIIEDIKWLVGEPSGGIFYGSDYFEKTYDFAVELIKKELAYVCDLSPEEIREYRGTLTEPGRNSPYRDRSVEENLDLFARMRNGEFEEGSRTLRAKIDMASPNITLRDPVIYRIVKTPHHRQGSKWCIYPMYDFAHPIQDGLENITHSLCSIEFDNNRPLYDWVANNIGFDPMPRQFEFARLNVTYTVLGKRHLTRLVSSGAVDGWDDPRMPTLSGLRRRGYTPSSICEFVKRAGYSKVYSLVDGRMLDFCIRNELNATAPRRICVSEPLKVTITNFPEGKVEMVELPNNPEDPSAGTRELPFTREIYIERSDFEETPPPKFFRLKPGGEVRLMGTYYLTCNEVVKDENGEVKELLCTIDPETRSGQSPDGRKVKATIHWLSSSNAIEADLMLFENLLTLENPNDMPEGSTIDEFVNPDSLKKLVGCKLEPSLKDARVGEQFQFVRLGYFCLDSKYKNTFNRIVPLKDGYKPDK